jgi:hypothetical protein
MVFSIAAKFVAPEIHESIGTMLTLAWKCQHIRARRRANGAPK